ncbi:MAG: PD-(D/E)XK nuclease family protein, partial [Clostridia bacterium]|nr:PD-(D/E)XK nuclease family protein [Clostridia bacterium]
GRYETNSGKVCVHFVGKEEKKAAEKRGVYSVKAQAGKKTDEESLLAKTIRAIIEDERHNKFYDPDTGEYRAIRYADIAVLSRKKQGQIARTVESLATEGVPVNAAAAVNICEFSEIKTLIDLLSLIDNGAQDIALCSVLLSAVGNLTADDLTEIRLAYKDERFFRTACKRYAVEQDNLLAYRLRKFYAYFDQLRVLSRVLDAGELLTRVVSENRMESDLLARTNGVAAVRRIRRFIEEASSPEPLCVHAFLDRLRDLGYKIEYSENGGEDSVKVLTMHSSKGLEYPIVILDNLSAPFRGVDRDEVEVEENYGLAPYAFDEESMTKSTTLLRRLHEQNEEESSRADGLNLYYVALTRAKYGLHMLFEGPTAMPDVKYARSFAEFTDFSVWQEYVVNDESVDIPKQERTALVFRPDEGLAREIMQAFLWEYAHTGLENLPVKSSATQLLARPVYGEEPDAKKLFDEGEDYDKKGETSKEAGIAYHAFLENFDFSLLYDGEGKLIEKSLLQELIKKEKDGGRCEASLLNEQKLAGILSNPVFRALQGKRLYKEQKFLVALPIADTYAKKEGEDSALLSQNEEEILFQGAIDLLAVGEDNEVQIVDYKFSRGGADYLKKHYAPQLDLYRRAVSKIMRIPLEKIRCSIVNIYYGFQVDFEF